MKDFIFIHIPRTAGNSMLRVLPMKRKDDTHMTAIQRIKEVGKTKWESSFTFAFIRNPWDRVVSWYLFHCNKFTSITKNFYKKSFEEWVTSGLRTHWETSGVKFMGAHPLNLCDYILDNQDNCLVNFIGRYETLQKDFNFVCAKLGIKQRVLPRIYRTRRNGITYRGYYTEKTREFVGHKFRKDIKLFNYRF